MPEALKVADGSRVVITILEPHTGNKKKLLPEKIEEEDVEFVRACRGRLAIQLQDLGE